MQRLANSPHLMRLILIERLGHLHSGIVGIHRRPAA